MGGSAIMFDDGAAYERMMGRWSRRVGDDVLAWLDLPPGLRWLDVGCGSGAFTELAIGRVAPAAISGVDPSESQLAFARTRPGARHATFERAAAESLPFADDSFDVAMMALVIAFVADPPRAVAEMARVVRPGGRVAAYMWDFPAAGSPTAPVGAAARALGLTAPSPPNAAVAQAGAMAALWQGAGLVGIAQRVVRLSVGFASLDDFWTANSAGPAGQFLRGLPPERHGAVRAQLAAQLPTQPDGRIVLDAVANAIQGRVPG